MASFIVKRFLQGLLTVWFIATATFFAMHNVPGDPLLNDRAVSEAIRENLDGVSNKKKIRVRWYGEKNKLSKPQLEIKSKKGSETSKKNYQKFKLIFIANFC